MSATWHAQPTQIPFDLYEVIVEKLLYSSGVHSLKSLSLTCNALLHLCRRHIFRNITISWYTTKCRAETSRLCSLLQSSPCLLSYIRGLQCSISTLDPYPTPFINILQSLQHQNVERFSFYASGSINRNDAFIDVFIPILQNLVGNTKIHTASFGNLAGLSRRVLETIPVTMKALLLHETHIYQDHDSSCNLLFLPTITSFTFRGSLHHHLIGLWTMPNLENLILDSSEHLAELPQWLWVHNDLTCLRSLTIVVRHLSSTPNRAWWLMNLPTFPATPHLLERFTLELNWVGTYDPNVLREAHRNLEHFFLEPHFFRLQNVTLKANAFAFWASDRTRADEQLIKLFNELHGSTK